MYPNIDKHVTIQKQILVMTILNIRWKYIKILNWDTLIVQSHEM